MTRVSVVQWKNTANTADKRGGKVLEVVEGHVGRGYLEWE